MGTPEPTGTGPVAGAWPVVTGCVGPRSGAVWNSLSVAQVEAMDAAMKRGGGVPAVVAATGADRSAVLAVLQNRRKRNGGG